MIVILYLADTEICNNYENKGLEPHLPPFFFINIIIINYLDSSQVVN